MYRISLVSLSPSKFQKMSFYKDIQYTKAPYSVRIVKFGCENCGRRWQSANGSLKDYQKCKNCFSKCYPSSYKIQAPNKRGNENRGTFQAHNTELCGRCARLGYSCMELGNSVDQDNIIVSAADDEEVVLTKSNDLSSYIVTNEKKNKKSKAKKDSETNVRNIKTNLQSSIVLSMTFNDKSSYQNDNQLNTSNVEDDIKDSISALEIGEETCYYDKNDEVLNMDDYKYLDDEQKMFRENFSDNVNDDQVYQ